MNLYEVVFIIRQDVSSADIDKIIEEFSKIVTDFKGKIHKTEYWGIRPLAYEINNNKKGHYYFIGIEANNDALKEMNRKLSLSESIIRSSIIRAEEISTKPSPILEAEQELGAETVDVTIDNEKK